MTDYREHLTSAKWQSMRRAVFNRCDGICERCRNAWATEVHHLTYDRLGDERLSDLKAVCADCHKMEDGERRRRTAVRREQSRFHGWMAARHGSDWEQRIEATDDDYDRFDAWLEKEYDQ